VSPAPDDDAERLVLADELLAKGDARGELIVVQCELARGGFSRERGIALRKRELALLLAHEDAWANLDGLARSWTFRRGFVDEIAIDVTKFAEHEDEIWKRAPYLRWLRFNGLGYDSPVDDLGDASREWERVRPRLERALESGRVHYFSAEDARVRWMEDGTMSRHLTGGSLDDVIARWVTTAYAVQIRGLALNDVSPWTLRSLAGTDLHVEELELEGCLFDADPLPRVPVAPRRAKLLNRRARDRDDELLAGRFGVRLTDLTTFHLRLVLESGRAAQLRELRVSPGDDGETIEALAISPELAGLEHLALDAFVGRPVEVELEPLYTPEHLDSLRTVRFGPMSLEAARALLRSRLATQLEMIDLRHSKEALEPHAEELRGLWDGQLLF
jgi:uncharacterized protein (TIGR02996 family)